MEKVAKNGRKVKAIEEKLEEKLRPYFFAVFWPLMKNGKSR